MNSTDRGKTIFLIDAHSLIHRCFHALPPFTNAAGEPVGALYGIASVLLKIVEQKRPDYAVALFDRPEPTFRKEKFLAYKAQRPKAPDELVAQLISAHELFKTFSIATLEVPGFEGDDLIGTCAAQFSKEKNLQVVILTGDLDALQLVRDGHVIVETFKKGISDTLMYDEAAVKNRYGITPAQLIDYKALVGDQSDNIPGVMGVGPKTAETILQTYGSLENFFTHGQTDRAYEKIISHKDEALLSQDLATIRTNAPINPLLTSLTCAPNWGKVTVFFEKNGFTSLIKRIPHAPSASLEPQRGPRSTSPAPTHATQQTLLSPQKNPTPSATAHKTILYNAKEVLKRSAATQPVFDLMIAAQLLGIETSSWEDLSRTLFKKELPYNELAPRAQKVLTEKLAHAGLNDVFEKIETPLIPIVAAMETAGVLVDPSALSAVTTDITDAISAQEKKVKSLMSAGSAINLNSPKQLLGYFQNTMGLKIKSTSADALEKIALKNPSPLFNELLAYRELFKLKTTYCDALTRLVAPDGRIHPTFLQLGAATGRMSCQNPNLQNIPQESTWSARIRNVFVAPTDATLVAFDYSQIELRVLAHLSRDPHMTEAFIAGKDIHTITASRVFGVPANDVTKEMRRLAKTLNFGMIYGMGSRAFAQTAGISAVQAKEFISKYFSEFSHVKEWQRRILEEARATGVARTATGRMRPLPALHSYNQWMASEAERMAINMPTQGLAADILKLATIKTNAYIEKNHLHDDIRLILSIHDELIFEMRQATLEKNTKLPAALASEMETAYTLSVPLKVEYKTGVCWGEMK
ncbi:MAG: DNA polymerase [Candidatus Paceibacterota bacterium]|jgi:DNA polymerase-1